MFFESWQGLLRVVIVGSLAYVAIVVLLRITGKRTLSKMNAFDFIVTVALGSTLATVLLSKDVALAEGVMAFCVLIFLQLLITWLTVRYENFENLVKAEPTLLFFEGQLLHRAMLRERISRAEVHSAIREQGIATMDDVMAVVLETNGQIAVIRQTGAERRDTLEQVSNFPS